MKKTKLAALISLTLANVAALSCLTFAWFAAQNTVSSASSDLMAVGEPEISVSHKIYAWDDDAQAGVESLNDDGSYKFNLEQYDSYITDRNVTLSKIIRFELHKDVVLDEGITFQVKIPCSGLLFDDDDKITNNISNIIKFRYFVDSRNDSEDPDVIYNRAMDIVNGTSNSGISTSSTSFVTLDDSSGVVEATKENILVIKDLQFEEDSDVTYFFLEYNYSVELVNFYYNHSDMEAPGVDSLEGDEVSFLGDIHRMVFGLTEEEHA